MSSLRKNLLSRGGKRLSNDSSPKTPVKWSEYFDSEEDVILDRGTIHVFRKGSTGPVIVAIHGAGYSGLTWAVFVKEIVDLVECQILALDLRGHGRSNVEDGENLSLENLASDVIDVLDKLYTSNHPNFVIVGHSMGGAVAVEVAKNYPIAGLVVIDVVEGSAMESLSSMQSILRGRPTTFDSVESAIFWACRSGMTTNLEAARVSVPGQIKNIQTNQLASIESWSSSSEEGSPPRQDQKNCSTSGEESLNFSRDSIPEEDELDSERVSTSKTQDNGTSSPHPKKQTATFTKPMLPPYGAGSPPSKLQAQADRNLSVSRTSSKKYMWRIDLSKTEEFWTGWFQGLSQKFLDCPAPKILLLANIHGLDTTLTVGQMQGKFQLQVMSRSGHAIHEDQPHHVAEIIGGFLVKQKLAVPLQGFVPAMPAC